MSAVSFNVRVTRILEAILEQLESCEALDDLDMDLVDGVLKLVFEDGSQVIINRQEPLEQIWLASPLGPAHFGFDPAQSRWVDDRTGEGLRETLEKALSIKTGSVIRLEDWAD